MKLSDALGGFFITLAADGYSRNTVEVYKWGLGLLCTYLDDPEIEEISSNSLKEFFAWVQTDYTPKRPNGNKSPLKPSSIDNIWIASRSFFNFAENELEIERQDQNIKRPKYAPPISYPLTEEEVQLLLKATGNSAKRLRNRDRAILLMLLDTGVRVSELLRLRVRDIDLESGAVHVMPYGTGAKTKPRTVFIGKATRKALWLYFAEREEKYSNDPFFLTNDNRPFTRHSIRLVIRRLAKSAGIENVHPHRFRHTFAIMFLRNGGNVYALQRLLGHSTLEMVKRYLRISELDTEQAHRQASPVDRWRL